MASERRPQESNSEQRLTEKHIVTVDMRNNHANGGQIYLGRADRKSDVTIKMNSDTFGQLCDKKLNGFKAFITGKLSFDGSLGTIKKFDKEVVVRYLN